MYNREKAVQYAEKHWNQPNPNYRYFSEDDCTNFVSQCVYAGGFPMEYTGSVSRGWWYRRRQGANDTWSYSWAVAHSFYLYLKQKANEVDRVQDLEIGDVICFDWEGDGRWNHNVIVTWKDENGEAYVHAHSTNSRFRYWKYLDSPAYTKNTRYAFFHIPN